ncbi:MAG: hypothetical protein JL50_19840 [Peptococcaceae bacterium BICA1-7]|nr:MAG: hypothetical protein JL50_19840 [Peptococcaceae bacterium BICA1-7]HBV98330.1 hypothetical protein [Desulfotomaculum sp.]
MTEVLAFVFLMAGLLMLSGRIVVKNITLLAIQSAALSGIAFYLGFAGSEISWHMMFMGGLTLAVKVIVLPMLLYRTAIRVVVYREVPLSIGMGPSLLIGVLLVALTYVYIVPVLLIEIHSQTMLFPVALSTVLLGCFFMVSRRSAFNQIIGIIEMENGLFLCALAVTGGMPLIIELGIFFDLLVGAIVMGIMTHKIRGTFDTLDTKELSRLKG